NDRHGLALDHARTADLSSSQPRATTAITLDRRLSLASLCCPSPRVTRRPADAQLELRGTDRAARPACARFGTRASCNRGSERMGRTHTVVAGETLSALA